MEAGNTTSLSAARRQLRTPQKWRFAFQRKKGKKGSGRLRLKESAVDSFNLNFVIKGKSLTLSTGGRPETCLKDSEIKKQLDSVREFLFRLKGNKERSKRWVEKTEKRGEGMMEPKKET